jgi:hypothetical protein
MYFSIDLSLERNCSRHRVACTERSSTGGIKPRFALTSAGQENFINMPNTLQRALRTLRRRFGILDADGEDYSHD